jgi:tetratricopeptide (TPR) repeat protein
LQHIAEPSTKERLHKWVRRHPRLLLAGLVGGVAVILLVAIGMVSENRARQLDAWRQQEQERLELHHARQQATAAFAQLQDEARTAQFLLYTRTNEPEQLATGVAIGTRLINSYGVLDNPSWQEAPLVQALPSADQMQLRDTMAELLLLTARALHLQHKRSAKASPSPDLLHQALLMNERAADCSHVQKASPALWRQRGALYAALGQDDKARASEAQAENLPLATAADHYWLASDHLATGRLREALVLLQKAVVDEPQNFWASFVLAHCHERMAQDARAEARYGTCIALKPGFPWSHFNRGLALLRQQEFRAACADFDTVLKLKPDVLDAYLNRALAHQGLQEFEEAERDLTAAIERGGPTRLYFLRARVREKRGNKAGAQSDYDVGVRQPPRDEKSWLTRGYYYLGRDPQAALADFEHALRLNPRSADALQNKAHVLAEKLGRNQDALLALDQLLALYPDAALARSGRGVLLARLGQRVAALRDADEALRLDVGGQRLYQVACIYALTSKLQPEDRLQAMQHLSSALRKGYGFQLLETDRDLDPLRALPEFRRLVDATRTLHLTSPKINKS